MNQNASCADIFEKIGELLELEEANPFRVRAYRRAALSLRALTGDLAEINKRNGLGTIPGIGPDLEAKIKEYLQNGTIAFYERLRKKTPPLMLEMLKIPGVGPATTRLIYKKFRPKTLQDLHRLAEAGKLSRLPGIKGKTEQNILQGIDFLERHRSREPIGTVLPMARKLVEELQKERFVQAIALAGSLRRWCETVKDVDILIASKKPRPIMDAFIGSPKVQKVLAHGMTKSSVLMEGDRQVDLRIVEPESFGAALLYFTGSKAHNIKLRGLAKKKGYKINEYGLFVERTGKRKAGATEEEMYQALGLKEIAPELREDQGEVEAALTGTLPDLVNRKDLRGDFHLHSNWSDGANAIEEMVQSAKKAGLGFMVLTDHSQSLKVAGGLSPSRLKDQIQRIRKINEGLEGFRLLCGSEVDILEDGRLDYPDDLLVKLDFVVASIHSGFKQSKDQITWRILKAMRHPCVNCIAHPTGRLLGEREAYEVDLEAVLEGALKTQTALEINAHPKRLDLNDRWAYRARELGVRLAVNSDSHVWDQFDNLDYGVAVARRAWCEKKHLLNGFSVRELKDWVLRKRTLGETHGTAE